MIITNIGELVGIVPEGVLRKCGAEMSETGILRNAWLRIKDGLITDFGVMPERSSSLLAGDVSTPGSGQGEGPVGSKLLRSDDADDDGRGRSGGDARSWPGMTERSSRRGKRPPRDGRDQAGRRFCFERP